MAKCRNRGGWLSSNSFQNAPMLFLEQDKLLSNHADGYTLGVLG